MSGKNLRIGLLAAVDLDPRDSQDYLSTMALELLFETPFAIPESGQPPVPILMRDRLRQTGAGEYRGRIRDDIRFSDGLELTAGGLVKSLSASRAIAKEAEVHLDGDQIVFSLRRPNASFELFLTQRFCAVTRPQANGTLLGSGPFVLADDSTQQRIHLIPNPHYRKKSEIEEVEFVVYPPTADAEPEALLEALQSGDVDLTNALTRQALRKVKGLRTWFEPGNSTAILFFNTLPTLE